MPILNNLYQNILVLLVNPFTLEQYLNRNRSAIYFHDMFRKTVLRLVILCLLSSSVTIVDAQFYNGLQMTFGKNRVQYYDYYWSFYRFEDIDCYFNENGRELAQFTADYGIKKLEEVEDYFDYNLEKRLIFIIFNKQAEYKQ